MPDHLGKEIDAKFFENMDSEDKRQRIVMAEVRRKTRTGMAVDELWAVKPWGPEQLHPKWLLAELAEEFDRGIDI